MVMRNLTTFFMLFLVLSLNGCGNENHNDADTGSVAFGIAWQTTPANTTDSGAPHAKVMAAASIDCATIGISTVSSIVYDASNNSIASGGPWNCTDHTGTVNSIPAGSNRKFAVLGKDSAGNVLYRGEQAGVTITSGQTTNVGTITASIFAPSLVSPSDASTVSASSLSFSWTGSGASYQLQVATSNTFGTTAIDTTVSVTSYTPTSLPAGSYYWRIRAKDISGNTSNWSSIWNFTVSSSTGTTTSSGFKMPDTNQTTSYTSTFGEDHDYTINPPSYTDNGNGTITDNVTGRIWQKQDDGVAKTWANASTYCDSLVFGGQTDWRLPSRIELVSIVDYGIYGPAINSTFFPGTISLGDYWSSSNISNPWYVDFGQGLTEAYAASNLSYVRCVRGGQSTTTSLTDNGNGTVMDSGTLLIWQQGENNGMLWEAALSYCEGLSLAGSTDWRLPNIKELSSLADDTKYNPAINTALFPNAKIGDYWSSTTNAYSPSVYAWSVDFSTGYTGCLANKTSTHYLRCVRGGQ